MLLGEKKNNVIINSLALNYRVLNKQREDILRPFMSRILSRSATLEVAASNGVLLKWSVA
jgi:hypothetical protein